MNIDFKQERFKKNFIYFATFDCGKKIKVIANRTLLPFTSRDVIIQDEKNNTIVNMKEKRILKKFLYRIPIINFFVKKSDQYYIYKDNDLIGSIEYSSDILINYRHRDYKVYNKSRGKQNRFYIFEGKKQIGIIDKNFITINNADHYKGIFNNDTDEILNIIIFTFIDLSMYTEDIRSSLYSVEMEFTLIEFKRKLDVVLNDDWKAK